MVIRRIRQSAAEQNWFAVALDLLILVIGVFLGMQANNWNQARLERQQEQSYRTRLIEDLRTNETDLQQRRAYYGQVRKHALAALNALENSAGPADQQFLIDSYQATQIIPRTLTRFTYEEMLASGGVERIGGSDIRKHVKNYYAGIDTAETTFRSTPPYREHLRTVMPYAMQQRVRTNCREVLGTGGSGEQMNVLPASCRLNADAVSIVQAAEAVRASPSMKGDLTRHLIDLDLKLELFELVGARARNLRRILEAKGGRVSEIRHDP
ncbi:MAG TPA: hypothetical protein VFO45_00705 [Sphingomicrobium sp.]|nr:hypothetical protein [Sphingomicrobium sp.]